MTEILSTTRDPDTPWIEKPDTVDRILRDLAAHTLDPVFEQYGDFCDRHPEWLTEAAKKKYAGCTRFWGNFLEHAGLFDVITDDRETIARLSKAIARNKATPQYIEARRVQAAREAERRAEMERDRQRRIAFAEVANG